MSSSPSQAEVAEMLKTQMYNPSIIPSLEAYLHSQADPKNPAPYYFDANRVLVKQYTFSPQLMNIENLILAQLLSIIYGSCDGRVDFGALHCLVPERSRQGEIFAVVTSCADLMSSCQFSEFWEAYKRLGSQVSFSSVQALAHSPISYLQLRKSILSILSLTFKSISIDDAVLSSLNFTNEQELKDMLDSGAAKDIVDGLTDGKLSFSPRAENTKKVKVFQESVDFGVIQGLLNSGQ